MSGLVLKLSPRERILINGAVLENGERRSRVTVLTANASILRLKDAIHPDDANTPVKRACYYAQLLLSGDIDTEAAKQRLDGQIRLLKDAFQDAQSKHHLDRAIEALKSQNAYSCLKALRLLLPLESQLLALKRQ